MNKAKALPSGFFDFSVITSNICFNNYLVILKYTGSV
jgi:hypothetical protein